MYKMVRAEIEKMYNDTCDVIVRVKTKNAQTGQSEFADSTLYTSQACKLSFGSQAPVSDDSSSVAETRQVTKLFIAPELDIPAGSKIVVSHVGKTFEFTNSGLPSSFDTHQEIQLKEFQRWA